VLRTGNNRKNMVRSIEASLKRLKTDRIDLYRVHMDDGVTRMEEIVRGFDDLVRAGKILYVGLSDFPAWQSLPTNWPGWTPLAPSRWVSPSTSSRPLCRMRVAVSIRSCLRQRGTLMKGDLSVGRS
jgi:hypothetical protein